jgi:X-Pro dipeptidyl-peptidase
VLAGRCDARVCEFSGDQDVTYRVDSVCLLAAALTAILTNTRVAAGWQAPANDEPGTSKAVQVFKDGEAQVVPAFEERKDWIRHDLWVETEFDSDGDGRMDRMHVSVTRPQQTETEGLKVHVIYETSPYYAGTGSNDPQHFWDPRQELGVEQRRHVVPTPIPQESHRPTISRTHENDWIPRGFAVVHSSSPGTGLSQGCPTVGGDNESLAPKAVIDWLNGRAQGFTEATGGEPVVANWTTGRVGMTGTSYNGTLPLAAATTGVEGLMAIIPIAPNTSYYHYYRSHGLIRHPGGYMGEDIDVLYDFIASGDPARRDYCHSNVREKELLKEQDRVTGDYNDFWAGRDYMNDLAPLKAATLMAHAFNDWNVMPEHSVRIAMALKAKGVPVQMYFHQGGHGGPPPLKQMNRWFTRYVCGVENGVENDPKAWIVREGKDRQEPTAYPDYPNPQAADVALVPQAGGVKSGRLIERPSTTGPSQGVETLVDNYSFSGDVLVQAEWTNHRLLYRTEKLQQPVHISGTPRLRIRVASSAPAANLSVWLVSLPWTKSEQITDNIITRGWVDPQNHSSLTDGEPLEPGQFYDLNFELQPDDQVIAAGEQIGLMIFSSDRDFTMWPAPGTELTIDLDATELTLPVVGGSTAFQTAVTGPTPVASNRPDRN